MSAEKLITEHLDLWTGAIARKSSSGRGSNRKIELSGIKKLRELILDLAVRGKLVEQDSREGTAAILIDKIDKEWDRPTRLTPLRRPKKQPEVTEGDQPFPVPQSWRFIRLGDAVEIIRGITFPASEKSKSPDTGRIACLRTSNVQDSIEMDDLLYIKDSFVSKEAQYIRKHDIVMSMANSRELVGKVAIIEDEPKSPMTFGGFLGVLRPLLIDPKYIMIVLRSPQTRATLIEDASQTTNIANISIGKLSPFVVGLPPLKEQHRIVQKVDELMALCDRLEEQTSDQLEAHETLVDTLFTTEQSIDKLKQAILQLAVMGRLVEQDANDEPAELLLNCLADDRKTWLETEASSNPECATMLRKLSKLRMAQPPFPLPRGWQCAHLIQICRILVDCHNKTAPYVDEGIPIIRTSNIRDRRFNLNNLSYVNEDTYAYWSRRCPPKPQDIIFTREAPMGEAAIIPEGRTWCLGQRTMLIRPMHEYINNQYLLLALTEPHLLEIASEKAIGSTVKHLRVGDVENLVVPVPPLEEQHRILKKVDEVFTLCDELKERLNQASDTRGKLADVIVEQAIS